MAKKRARVLLLISLGLILFLFNKIHAGLNASYFIINDITRVCGLDYAEINHNEYVKKLPKNWRVAADRYYGMDEYDSSYQAGDYTKIPENQYCAKLNYTSLKPSEINSIIKPRQNIFNIIFNNLYQIFFVFMIVAIAVSIDYFSGSFVKNGTHIDVHSNKKRLLGIFTVGMFLLLLIIWLILVVCSALLQWN